MGQIMTLPFPVEDDQAKKKNGVLSGHFWANTPTLNGQKTWKKKTKKIGHNGRSKKTMGSEELKNQKTLRIFRVQSKTPEAVFEAIRRHGERLNKCEGAELLAIMLDEIEIETILEKVLSLKNGKWVEDIAVRYNENGDNDPMLWPSKTYEEAINDIVYPKQHVRFLRIPE